MRKKIVLYIIISALMLIFAITEINKGSEKWFFAEPSTEIPLIGIMEAIYGWFHKVVAS